MKQDLIALWDGAQRILAFPLMKLQNGHLTVLDLLILLILLGMVLVLERYFRRLIMIRVLQRTKFEPSVQYAVGKISGYVFASFISRWKRS